MKQDILFWNYNSNKNVMRNERVTQMYDQNISGMWCVSDLIKHKAQRHFFFFSVFYTVEFALESNQVLE